MSKKIAIIGLGYVGLPLARLFATQYQVTGFDINQNRINELNSGTDKTFEVSDEVLQEVLVPHFKTAEKGLFCTANIDDVKDADIYIITVPTPVDKNNRPDLRPLYASSETVGKILKKGDIVIYESTVYPGVTEEECVPVLEKVSGLKFNVDLFCGYSPERINPGDKEKTVEKIMKVTSGSTPETALEVDNLYRSVITAGTHLAPSIKVAEASKVIENAQRDLNIAFVNELAKIFNLMEINTQDVLDAAGTKWNFLPFKPGLVGGHCIGVDPFYLAQKAQEIGYYSELVLTARRVNDSMAGFVASQIVKAMIKKSIQINGAEVLILGITFKENCGDVRNTKIVDVVAALKEYGINVTIFDPWANPTEVEHEYNLKILTELPSPNVIASEAKQTHTTKEEQSDFAGKYDAIILGVAHNEFLHLDLSLHLKDNAVVYDVKGVLKNSDARL
jgi:UDP-N-acetyl-D-galactosamine dehydrogenase